MPKRTPAEVLAELTGDNRTVTEAATHVRFTYEPCDCGHPDDHPAGEEA